MLVVRVESDPCPEWAEMPTELPSCWLGEGGQSCRTEAQRLRFEVIESMLGTVRVLGFVEIVLAVVSVTEQAKFSVDNQVKPLFGSDCPFFSVFPHLVIV